MNDFEKQWKKQEYNQEENQQIRIRYEFPQITIIFSILLKRNKYNSMQIVIEQPSLSIQKVKNRISSANFNSKKIKSLLSSRQTCDDIVPKTKQQQAKNNHSQQPTEHLKPINKKIPPQYGQLKLKASPHQLLTELIKPIKHQKTQEQTLLLKNCDKTKLIFWNKDLPITGNEKYLIVSADLIIDQDCFWDKLPSDNGNFPNSTLHTSHTLTTLNHNSSLSYRSRNNFSGTGHNKMLSGSSQTISNSYQKSRNPLLSSNKLTHLIKQWKNLHSKFDSEGRKVIVLWLIRKQITYSHLMEFSQANELPLHGIFYAKRKRANAFFDLGPIVKEIHQRFLESVINPQQPVEVNLRPQERKSIDLSKQMRKGRSKDMKNREFLQTVSGLSQIKKPLDSLTNRAIKSKLESKYVQNDQNSSSILNSQTCKEFQLSKNGKRSLGSIVIDEKRVRSILKKTGPISSNRVLKQGSMKINDMMENTNTIDIRIKCDVSPMMDEVKQDGEEAVIKEFEMSEKVIKERKFISPQIIILEGAKCSSKGHTQGETYHGKIPVLFNNHQERLIKVIQRLKQHQMQVNWSPAKNQVKAYYFKYEMVKENGLESVNSLVRQLMFKNNVQNEFTYDSHKMEAFRESKIEQILEQLSEVSKGQIQLESRTIEKDTEQLQLSEQQEELLMEKAEKKIEEVKKQAIDKMISLKGRNYTFENGQSIYYFVGDAFKRNYNLLYQEYYNQYEKELLTSLLSKNKHKEKSTTNGKSPMNGKSPRNEKKSDYSRATDCTINTQGDNSNITGEKIKIKQLELASIHFFESLNY